jgi:hypothetical protein
MKLLQSRSFFIPVIVLVMVFAGCFSTGSLQIANYHLQRPPGCVAINDTLWYDRTEITNMDWLEYIFWLQRVYGSEHQAYRSALPDSTVWERGAGSPQYGEPYITGVIYLRHPAYQNYPVVGISRQQALDYSRWRSDRVFEQRLADLGAIVPDPISSDTDSYFTIERFYDGSYPSLINPDQFRYYPHYRLPSADEFKQARQKADNMAGVAFAKCQTRKCRDCLRMFYYPDYNAADTTYSAKLSRLASNRNYPCSRFLQAAPVHLRGNVREWMEEPFTSAGIGWNDNPALVNKQLVFTDTLPNAWTGFRNVCTWRKIAE